MLCPRQWRETHRRGVETVARHEGFAVAVAVAVRFEHDVVELVPETGLVVDDLTDAAHRRRRRGRLERGWVLADPVQAVDQSSVRLRVPSRDRAPARSRTRRRTSRPCVWNRVGGDEIARMSSGRSGASRMSNRPSSPTTSSESPACRCCRAHRAAVRRGRRCPRHSRCGPRR